MFRVFSCLKWLTILIVMTLYCLAATKFCSMNARAAKLRGDFSYGVATLKRGYKGTYHKMSPKHLNRYITEFAGRHNVRDFDTIVQMEMLAKGFVGKRLRYQDLIK